MQPVAGVTMGAQHIGHQPLPHLLYRIEPRRIGRQPQNLDVFLAGAGQNFGMRVNGPVVPYQYHAPVAISRAHLAQPQADLRHARFRATLPDQLSRARVHRRQSAPLGVRAAGAMTRGLTVAAAPFIVPHCAR